MLNSLIFISTFLAMTSSLGLGFFSLFRNYRSRTVILWFLTTMAVAIWTGGYLLVVLSKTDILAFIFLKLVYIGAVLIPILSFNFIASFLYEETHYKILIKIGYIVALVFLILITFTKIVISGVQYMENFHRYEEVETIGFKIFLVYFLFYAVAGVYLLIKGYQSSGGFLRRQIFYLILASVVGFAGGISNFITDLTGIYPYGQLVVWLYPVFITYGIFMDEIQIKIKY